jgi:hypothetical protein
MSSPTPPLGGAPPPDPTADAGDENVVVTICKNGTGGYTVYAGDEPDEGDGGDMSGDDADAMGAGGAAPASPAPAAQGQPADSIGAALKIAMDIMSQSESSGGPSAEDNFAGGFGGMPPQTAAIAQKL